MTTIITCATSEIVAKTKRVLAKRSVRLVLQGWILMAAEEAHARLLAECPSGDVVVALSEQEEKR